MQSSYYILIRRAAREHGLPEALVTAIVEVESAGEAYAARFEPHYRYTWDAARGVPFRVEGGEAATVFAPEGFSVPEGAYVSRHTEWIHQKTSWGLMQVMGAVAREYGYAGLLTNLVEPNLGLEYGCRHLAALRDRLHAFHGWAGVVDAYNDGTAHIESDEDYPHRVAARSAEAAEILELP